MKTAAAGCDDDEDIRLNTQRQAEVPLVKYYIPADQDDKVAKIVSHSRLAYCQRELWSFRERIANDSLWRAFGV